MNRKASKSKSHFQQIFDVIPAVYLIKLRATERYEKHQKKIAAKLSRNVAENFNDEKVRVDSDEHEIMQASFTKSSKNSTR